MPKPDDTTGKLDPRAKSGDLNDQRCHFAMHHVIGQLPACCTVTDESDTRAVIVCSRHHVTVKLEAK